MIKKGCEKQDEKIKRLGISPKRIVFFRGQFGCSFEDAVEFALERKNIVAWNRKKDVKIIFKNWTLGAEQCGISADSARSAYLGGIPCNDWFFDDDMDFDSDEVFQRIESENKRLKQRVKIAKDILKKTFWYLSQIDLITIKKVTDFISED